jgi:hypothetical protein
MAQNSTSTSITRTIQTAADISAAPCLIQHDRPPANATRGHLFPQGKGNIPRRPERPQVPLQRVQEKTPLT